MTAPQVMVRGRPYDLVTGGAGFIGCNLANALLDEGRAVMIADNFTRPGVEANAEWLRRRHPGRLSIRGIDVRDADAVADLASRASAIYHLAAQVAVTTSVLEPREDLEVNLIGTLNVLEGARAASPCPPVLFASTNKVYGTLDHMEQVLTPAGYRFREGEGVDEHAPLDFHSPYGCSKGAADQYVRDYARIYGVPTVVFRLSCVYGEHQHGTEDQGWLAHLGRSVLDGRPITIYGDGSQARDVLWVGDLVRAMRSAMARAEQLAGAVFNIGGGSANVVSVRSAVDMLMELAGRRVPVRTSGWRPGDQRVYVSALDLARERLQWRPLVEVREGLGRLVRWLRAEQSAPLRGRARPRRPASRAAATAGRGG